MNRDGVKHDPGVVCYCTACILSHSSVAQHANNLTNISATLVGLSHIFDVDEEFTFLAEFHFDNTDGHGSDAALVTVVVQQSVEIWWQMLQLGNTYYLSKLKTASLMGSKGRVAVLVANKQSRMCQITNNECRDAGQAFMIHSGRTAYQGRVTSVVDNTLGVYDLDNGRVRLVTTLLKAAASHLQVLSIGDVVSVHWPHLVTVPQHTLLWCCARTTLRLDRASEGVTVCAVSATLAQLQLAHHTTWLLHALRHLQLGSNVSEDRAWMQLSQLLRSWHGRRRHRNASSQQGVKQSHHDMKQLHHDGKLLQCNVKPLQHGTAPLPHGTAPLPHGIKPLPHGTALSLSSHDIKPLPHGTVPLPHDIKPLPHGTAPSLHDIKPLPHGTAPSLHDIKPLPHGTALSLHDIKPVPHGTALSLHDIKPVPHGTTPLLHGTTPLLHGTTPLLHGTTPLQHGTTPLLHGTTPAAPLQYCYDNFIDHYHVCFPLQECEVPFELVTLEELQNLEEEAVVAGSSSSVTDNGCYWQSYVTSPATAGDAVLLCTLNAAVDGALSASLTRKNLIPSPLSNKNCKISSTNEPTSEELISNNRENILHFSQSILCEAASNIRTNMDSAEPKPPRDDGNAMDTDAMTSVPVVVVGQDPRCAGSSIIGKCVALLNPILVKEVFNVATDERQSKSIKKHYLVVHVEDILLADHIGEESCRRDTELHSNLLQGGNDHYELQISFKSNLLVTNVKNMERKEGNAGCEEFMFVCKARIQKNNLSSMKVLEQKACLSKSNSIEPNFVTNPVEQSDFTFVRLQGNSCIRNYWSLSQMCRVTMSVPAGTLPRMISHRWLLPLSPLVDKCNYNCLTFPKSSIAHNVSLSHIRDDISVIQILQNSIPMSKYLTVVGKIRHRYHMTPIYKSELRDTNNEHKDYVGVPGSKTIRLLLQERPRSTINAVEITAYISLKNNYLTGKFPLGLIPGATVRLIGVVKRSSRTNNHPYLEGNAFTTVEIVSVPDVTTTLCRPKTDAESLAKCKDAAPLLFLFQVCVDTSVHNPLPERSANRPCELLFSKYAKMSVFKTFAKIERINKICISLNCESCNSAKLSSGSCAYVGCYDDSPAVITAFARISVEDSGCRASIIFKSEQLLKELLKIPSNIWQQIVTFVKEFNCEMIYIPKHSSDGEFVDPATLLDNLKFETQNRKNIEMSRSLTGIFHNYSCSWDVYRTVLLLLRPLKPSSEYSCKQEVTSFYCLDLENIAPEAHAKLLEDLLDTS